MLDDSRGRKFSINLQNECIAIFIESMPNEIAIYIYDDEAKGYIFNILKELSPLESSILFVLLSNSGHIVSNSTLQRSGVSDKLITSNNLRQLILSLRSLLMDCDKPHRVIKNKPRIGYGIYHVQVFYEAIDLYLAQSRDSDKNDRKQALTCEVERDRDKEKDRYQDKDKDKDKENISQCKKKRINFHRIVPGYTKLTSKAINILSFLFFCIITWMVSNHNKASDELINFSLSTHTESIVNNKLKIIAFHRGNDNTLYIQTIKNAFMKYLASDDNEKSVKIMIFSSHGSILLSCIYDQEQFLFQHFQLTEKRFSSNFSIDEIARQCIHISTQ
ncbi:winged helix-turn-helix domain-containing protein [Budviciaceae bacterium BWR-B9]|uniref:Winged helix-turn-helix domain-containing protein n=1 Tax=Limnobaculum allomyrinae TaxID=2791986 RepID=A0ABS1IP99_9GAMM|nr:MULTISPECIES: winged helix-turn-helix domain-containing protein [Limnobaculum]MBK5143537.1 winged helix-turn-helix domain-containing protein [Limnobaculum allomyrinae]MBV7691425.1 winged helix-turn-helix domain-containing protein [Limnobaculum sp. M2-1]